MSQRECAREYLKELFGLNLECCEREEIGETISKYHERIWMYEWRHVCYEMTSCVGDEFGDVEKQSRDLVLIRITCESCENDI